MPGGFAFETPLLSLFTARDAVGAREDSGDQVKEDGIVGRGVAGPESEISVVESVEAMGINAPFIWALGHNEKPCAFATRDRSTAPGTSLKARWPTQVTGSVATNVEYQPGFVQFEDAELLMEVRHLCLKIPRKRRGVSLLGSRRTHSAACVSVRANLLRRRHKR